MNLRNGFPNPSETPESDSGGGLYVHIAYCRRKCLYCDFFSAGSRIADWHGYADALIAEFRSRINELPCPLRTVYFGGGTPSLMPPREFLRVAEAVAPYLSGIEEFTVEVNPDDVTEENLKAWKRGGANRLSMGVQCFDNKVLSAIGRLHDAETALTAYGKARGHFSNISIDLMFGLPGQTFGMWKTDVETALRLHPEHISAYSLMYEPGTAITALRDSLRIEEAPEETSQRMFSFLVERLRAAGYDHYEISNFAKPGFRSLHNSSYWCQKPYLGIGPSAHSYDGMRLRKANRPDLKGYLGHWDGEDMQAASVNPVQTCEILSADELREEYIMTRLRTREGIPMDDFTRRFGEEERAVLMKKAAPFISEGRLELSGQGLSLSESAILLSDSIIVELF